MEIYIPDLSELRPCSLDLALLKITGLGHNDYQAYALIVNFVRVVDMASLDFQNCRASLLNFWSRSDNSTVPLGFLIIGAGHFEACISNLKRAIEFLKAIRGYSSLNQSAQTLVRKKYTVISGTVEKAVTDMRNAIQHLYGDIKKGSISDGQPVYPSSTDMDGMKLGQYKILFIDLASWLKELHMISHELVIDWKNLSK